VHVDVAYPELQELYRSAAVYWHAAGYGVDAAESPIELEHFGMTTAEAMAQGAVPVVFAAGGQLEVVEDGVSGFHWRNPAQLAARTRELAADEALRRRMAVAARERAQRYSRAEFKRRMRDSLAPLVAELGRG
jgi:glycosyltransferase involved in cell wall biosynthesis